MAKIQLNAASGGGSVALEGPASLGSDKIIKFPNAHGVIVQVVQTLKTNVFTSSAENSFTDITGMSVNITPTSSSSKILVSVNMNASNGSDVLHVFRLLRGSTEIGSDTFASAANGFAIFDSEAVGSQSRYVGHVKGEILDSPSTTSQITYKVQFFKNGSANMHVNRRALNTGAGSTSQITAYEVAS
tara:strand:+ start:176 stop:736 length:561 start_codon:yes stop_codon:yes gene_type:complete